MAAGGGAKERRAARGDVLVPKVKPGAAQAARKARAREEQAKRNTLMQLPKAARRLPKRLTLGQIRAGGTHARLLQAHPELKWLKPCLQHFRSLFVVCCLSLSFSASFFLSDSFLFLSV